MASKVAEIADIFVQDNPAGWVGNLWDQWNNQRSEKVAEWLELRNFVFATDTSTTTNSSLPWKNSTTIPKLCQIRDNLHSNYKSALFPNDEWLTWKGYSQEDSILDKARAIESYMKNKVRQSGDMNEISKLLYDYIDYGNAFAMPTFESRYKTLEDGTEVPDYIGPKMVRISPLDIVFNPLSTSFRESPKIVRYVRTIGDLKRMAMDNPEQSFWEDALKNREEWRRRLGAYTKEDFNKAVAFSVDGFGSLYEYLQSNYVEILVFYGDFHDLETGELRTNQQITVVDRCYTADQRDIESWFGHAPIYHVGWRFRPDNLWAMGPLDNLVGMQYRIDHLENLKADAQDLIVHPPLKIIGEVEEFDWFPGAEIHIDENGDVQEVAKNLNGILSASNEIQQLEDRMEAYAGAPREAMGIRTPGEKTAFEVQQLQNAAGRIFQEKITNFEQMLLEPLLNAMLETARRNMDQADVIRVMNNDTGVEAFRTVTKEDITANGLLRPIGARHFAKQANDLQNLIGVMNSPIAQIIAPHTSGKEMTRLVNDILHLDGYNLFSPNVAIDEQAETQAYMNQASEDLEMQATTPAEGPA